MLTGHEGGTETDVFMLCVPAGFLLFSLYLPGGDAVVSTAGCGFKLSVKGLHAC